MRQIAARDATQAQRTWWSSLTRRQCRDSLFGSCRRHRTSGVWEPGRPRRLAPPLQRSRWRGEALGSEWIGVNSTELSDREEILADDLINESQPIRIVRFSRFLHFAMRDTARQRTTITVQGQASPFPQASWLVRLHPSWLRSLRDPLAGACTCRICSTNSAISRAQPWTGTR